MIIFMLYIIDSTEKSNQTKTDFQWLDPDGKPGSYFGSHLSHEVIVLFVLHKLVLQTRMHSYPVGLDV